MTRWRTFCADVVDACLTLRGSIALPGPARPRLVADRPVVLIGRGPLSGKLQCMLTRAHLLEAHLAAPQGLAVPHLPSRYVHSHASLSQSVACLLNCPRATGQWL